VVFVDTCVSVRGVGSRCGITSFIHTSWISVELNATELPSGLLYVAAELVIRKTMMKTNIFKHYSTTPSNYKNSQILELIVRSATAYN
jgi:hypothetical protein